MTDEEVKAALAEEIAAILAPVAQPDGDPPRNAPRTWCWWSASTAPARPPPSPSSASNTARRASPAPSSPATPSAPPPWSSSQIWGERTGCPVHAPAKPGADAAGLAFDALRAAKEAGTQVLLVDTAGRLHNKAALMEELRKIIRVLKRQDETAPHSVLLVLDATTGQNAIQQVRVFKEMVAVTGLAVTKLDGSAKGGVVVGAGGGVRPARPHGGRRRDGGRPPALRGAGLRAGAGRAGVAGSRCAAARCPAPLR